VNPVVLGLLAAAGNIIGAVVVVRHLRRGLTFIEGLIAFGAGFMLAVVLVGVLPEVFHRGAVLPGVFVFAGYFGVHLSQHVFTQHFHYGIETHRVGAKAGFSALVGLSIHSLFDGVAIAAGLLVSPQLGVLLFLAVFLHKLPEGVTIASLVMAGGQGARSAIGAAAVLGLATVLGVLLTDWAAPLAERGLALAAGVTLYVAASDLVPEFQAKRGWGTALPFFGGAAAFFLTHALLERWVG
jgi:ZIP family zinc transporter/zinc and cadmium transporter